MKARFLVASLLLLAGPPSLLAQNEKPPQSSDSSVVDRKAFEEARAKIVDVTPKKAQIEEAPPEKKIVAEGETQFFIRRIIIRGNQSIPTQELAPIGKPYVGRELTLSGANELAQKIEQEYRGRGYLTSTAYIPPQRIENETLHVQVVEGKLGKVPVEGNRWFSEATIRRYWLVKEGETLRYQRIAGSIRRANENPDHQVKAVLRPGEETGTTDIYLKVEEHFPAHGSFQYDNAGSRSTGKRRYGFTARHNNFLIPDSQFLIGTVFGWEFGSLFSQYLIPVSSHGTRLILGFSHSQVAPKEEFKPSDINGNSQTYSPALRQVLWESDSFTSQGSIGFDFKNSRTRDTGGSSRHDQLRVFRTGFDFSEYDRRGTTSLTNELSFSFQGLGATNKDSPLAGRTGADPKFIKYEGSLTRSLTLPFNTQAVLKTQYQFSLDKLTPSEEFYLGGAGTVRGYPEGDYLGDSGIFYSLEYLTPCFVVPGDWKLPRSAIPLRKQINFAFFVDEGYARLRGAAVDTLPGGDAPEVRSRHLVGIGAGIRIRLARNLLARLELAHALGEEPLTESDHTRFHFSIQTEI